MADSADSARDELVATFKDLLSSGEYSDLIITCGADAHKVHKAVVCSRSGFLKKAERFAVGKEAAESVINLPDDYPTLIKRLIQYLYEGEYEPKYHIANASFKPRKPIVLGLKIPGNHYRFPHTCESECPRDFKVCQHHQCNRSTCKEKCVGFVCLECCTTWIPPVTTKPKQMLLHAKMYELGDKYDVVGLKELAREKFQIWCERYWDEEDFAAAARCAFSTTPDKDAGLRDVVVRTVSGHIDLLNKPAVAAILNEFNGLAVGLLRMRAEDLGWSRSA